MKYVVFVPDGCADVPLHELGDRTPLEAARMPRLATLASNAVVRRAAYVDRRRVHTTTRSDRATGRVPAWRVRARGERVDGRVARRRARSSSVGRIERDADLAVGSGREALPAVVRRDVRRAGANV